VQCWGHPVTSIDGPIALPAAAKEIGVGANHACALLSTNEIACWGENTYRQLGVDEVATQSHGTLPPRLIPELRASQIAIGASNGCAIDLEHRVWCWGWSGQRESSPVHRIGDLADIVTIDTDGVEACGQRSNGELVCWDQSQPTRPVRSRGTFPLARALVVDEEVVGVLATDGHVTLVSDREKRAVDLPPARSLSMAGGARCAVLESGELRCWGRNDNGFLVIR
jgi:alpha-tubulin suppressor-like RCC1 family protein